MQKIVGYPIVKGQISGQKSFHPVVSSVEQISSCSGPVDVPLKPWSDPACSVKH